MTSTWVCSIRILSSVGGYYPAPLALLFVFRQRASCFCPLSWRADWPGAGKSQLKQTQPVTSDCGGLVDSKYTCSCHALSTHWSYQRHRDHVSGHILTPWEWIPAFHMQSPYQIAWLEIGKSTVTLKHKYIYLHTGKSPSCLPICLAFEIGSTLPNFWTRSTWRPCPWAPSELTPCPLCMADFQCNT